MHCFIMYIFLWRVVVLVVIGGGGWGMLSIHQVGIVTIVAAIDSLVGGISSQHTED